MNDFEKKQASQNKPASEAVSTESLKAMSPAELADALELALDSMTEENYDPDLIDAYCGRDYLGFDYGLVNPN